MGRPTVAVSLKSYFGHASGRAWFADVARRMRAHPAVEDGAVEVLVIPGFLQVEAALLEFADTRVRVGVQDVSPFEPGPYTGEVTAAELAEIGVAVAEIGHAERRRLFGETDHTARAKVAAALRHGVVPLLCVGEETGVGDETRQADGASAAPRTATQAAARTTAQLSAALQNAPCGRVIVGYEPVWAIGAAEPAPVDHIVPVLRALRTHLASLPGRQGSAVIYGGSAGPGMLTELNRSDIENADGLFLGRFAHDPDALVAVVDEAAAVAAGRADRN